MKKCKDCVFFHTKIPEYLIYEERGWCCVNPPDVIDQRLPLIHPDHPGCRFHLKENPFAKARENATQNKP